MTRIVVYELLSAGGLPLGPADAGLLAQGVAMRDALAADLAALPGLALSVAGCAAAPARHGRAVQALAGEAWPDTLRRLAATHERVWVIAPETDGLLARCQAIVGGARWVGCEAPAIAVASHKRRSLAALAAQGLPTPATVAPPLVARHWVVKPDQGAGAEGCQRVEGHAAAQRLAAARRAAGEAVLCQPWIEGEAMSLSLHCGAGQARLLSINHQCLQVLADGRLRFEGVRIGSVPLDAPRAVPLQALARGVARAVPGLAGFVGLDLVWHPRLGPVCIELNPRLSCAYVGQSARLGYNLAGALLAPWRDLSAVAEAAHG